MSLLYRYKDNTQELAVLLDGLKAHGHILFFVFDGKPPVEKEGEIQSRKDMKTLANAKAASIESFLQSESAKEMESSSRRLLEDSLARCQNNSWYVTREMRRAFQGNLWNKEIPYVKSISEADDVLVDLFAAGKLDVVLSSDMDYLLGGVKRLWIPTHKGTMYFEEVLLSDVLTGESISLESFIDGGLLCGTQERLFAKGVAPSVAFTWIRHYGSIEAILKSSINQHPLRQMFPDAESIRLIRDSVAPKAAYSRIRGDHLERVLHFLDGL